MPLLMEQTGYTMTGEIGMENGQHKKRIIRAAVFPVIAALVTVWWLMPIRILKEIEPDYLSSQKHGVLTTEPSG